MKAGPKIRCLKCLKVIQSRDRHDYVVCDCGEVAVDGGADYLKMSAVSGAHWEEVGESGGQEPDEGTGRTTDGRRTARD